MLAEHIDPFRQRTKVRGENASDRLLFVKNRWEKVVRDSEGDTSKYRVAFSKTHQAQLKFIDFIDEEIIENLKLRVDKLLKDLELSMDSMPPGVVDGYCFIIAELEAVING